MRILFLSVLSLICYFNALGQNRLDSAKTINEVIVKAYLSDQKLITLPSTAILINQLQLQKSSVQSILPVLNGVSGVKMEERSPGSYRLSIRGSLLRSPFGVRNIKIYYDDFPLTDAGGNTYINLIDQSAIQNIEILKGPDGSLFGANSGGVVLINSQAKTDEIKLNLGAGSYGLVKENISLNKVHSNFEYNIHQAFQTSDGYRDHSNLKRWFFQAGEKLNYNKKGSIKFSSFYSDLGYQTPGGLTLSQLQQNPKSSRPATATVPSATEQQAGIYNKSLFGGLQHVYQLNNHWKHTISFSGLTTDFQNPFITNYEKRKENSFAIRTFLEYKNDASTNLKYHWHLGWEFQNTNSAIVNYANNKGKPANVLAADRIKNQSQFIFTRFSFQKGLRFNAEASISLNFVNFGFEKLPESTPSSIVGQQNLKPQLMPKLALSYLINQKLVWRAMVSRGYSPPTAAEIRASGAKINPDLKAENGWNYELGLRFRTLSESIFIDIAAFSYRLNQAIVRRVNANDQDYYLNAGGTNQKGLELQLTAKIIDRSNGLVKKLNASSAFTLSDFKFKDYKIGSNDYSGNLLTGIPKTNISSNLDFSFRKDFNLFIQYQYNGKTSLNDASTVFADDYHLLFMKLGWEKKINKTVLYINTGADNLLNVNYSLGNDLNAFGNRYYNQAAKRNYFLGLGIKL
ncbi:MAG: TonB-dependent receptor [Pelobium sp.]